MNWAILVLTYFFIIGYPKFFGIHQNILRPDNSHAQLTTAFTANPDTCQVYLDSAIGTEDKFQYQKSYDFFQHYFESCAYLKSSWTYFLDIGVANSSRNQNNSRFQEFRDWLKKVLYYNPDTNYYCADVRQIIGTFAWFNDQRGKDNRGALAVAYFLVKENRCPELTEIGRA